jgi:hypothetical protein
MARRPHDFTPAWVTRILLARFPEIRGELLSSVAEGEHAQAASMEDMKARVEAAEALARQRWELNGLLSRRCNELEAALSRATGEPPSEAAVDPVGGTGTEGPRASDRDLDLKVGSPETETPAMSKFDYEPGKCRICADKGILPSEAIACYAHSNAFESERNTRLQKDLDAAEARADALAARLTQVTQALRALTREIGHIADYSRRCAHYGPADQLREHIANAVRIANSYDAVLAAVPGTTTVEEKDQAARGGTLEIRAGQELPQGNDGDS